MDDLTTTAQLTSWLAGHGLAGRRVRALKICSARRLPLGPPGPDEEPVEGLVRVGLREQGQDPRLPGPQ